MFVPYVKSLYKYAKVIVTSAKNNLVDYENYIKQTYGYKKQILKAIGLPYGFDFSYEKEMISSFRPEAKELLHQEKIIPAFLILGISILIQKSTKEKFSLLLEDGDAKLILYEILYTVQAYLMELFVS